jgi:hypothetical protein
MRFPPFLRPRIVLAASLLLTAAGLATAATRGRDPWAFRLILENKTRMLAVALRSDLWLAFNPANGGIYKVWNGGISYRGKVYDFSQNTSLTQGTTYHTQRNTILAASTHTSIPAGWTASGVTPGTSNWTFTGVGSVMTSPVFDFTGFDQPILTFFEQGGGPLRVQLSQDGGTTWTAQEFDSTQPGNSVQENQKLLVVSGANVRLRFLVQQASAANKRLSNIAIIGDYRVWSAVQNGSAVPLAVDWRGYRTVHDTDAIFIKYDLVLPGAVRVGIEENPEALPGMALTRSFTVSGLPANTTVSLKVNGTGLTENWSVQAGAGTLRTVGADKYLDLSANGATTLNVTWQ